MSNTTKIQISIGKFALITRLSHKALRNYENKKLLIPHRDELNNYRYYSSNQIEVGLKIKLLIWMGFGLAEIHEILQILENSDGDFQILDQKFKEKLHETELEIERLQMVKDILRGKKATEVLSMSITTPEIKQIPMIRAITKRAIGPIGETVGNLYGEIMKEIYHPDNQRGQVSICGSPFLIMHDQKMDLGYKEQNFDVDNSDIECGIPISGKVNISEQTELKNFPAVKVVSVIHTGPYSEVDVAYERLYKYLEAENMRPAGLCREIYLNQPQDVPEDKLLTEIQFPIQ